MTYLAKSDVTVFDLSFEQVYPSKKSMMDSNYSLQGIGANKVVSDIASYLKELPPSTFNQLYREPASCLSIFRLLPTLSKQIVMRMLHLPKVFHLKEFQVWFKASAQKELLQGLDQAHRLNILLERDNNWSMNEIFRKQFQNALTGRGDASSFGALAEKGSDKHAVEVSFLDRYAKEQWEAVLQFMVGNNTVVKPHSAVINLLEKSGLMQKTSPNSDLYITHRGFQFLLQDINSQVWALLLQYLAMSEELGMEEVDVLNFFFLLSSLELGCAYSSEVLTATQSSVLADMIAFGIVYRRKRKAKRFYPTRLATTLTNGKLAIQQTESEMDGFILLETNYRLYAYTQSELQISILQLFVELTTRFNTFVIGIITRESVESALKKGISAEQIITFLQNNAHPLMRKNTPVLPMTVVDQLRLWEMDLNRYTMEKSRLITGFTKQEEYESLRNYADRIKGLLAHSDKNWWMAVKEESYSAIVSYTARQKELRKEKSQQRDQRKHGPSGAVT